MRLTSAAVEYRQFLTRWSRVERSQLQMSTFRQPGERSEVDVDLHPVNPGQWMTHCHNIYHAARGMMVNLSYRTRPRPHTVPVASCGK